MTDRSTAPAAVTPTAWASPQMQARIRRRYRQERLFKLTGMGALVVSMDLNRERGEAVAKAAGARGFMEVDVADEGSVARAVDAACTRLGGLDVLIHAAGIAPSSPAQGTSLALWEKVFAVNATGTFLMNRAVFPHMREQGGSIINFASAAGALGLPNKSAYSAAKGAVLA